MSEIGDDASGVVVAPSPPEDVLALLAHDLADPLAAVSGLAKMLVDQHAEALPDDARRLAEEIAQTSLRANATVRQAVAFARADAADPHRTRVDLGMLTDEVFATVAELARAREATLERTSMPEIWARALPVQHIVLNLVSNAIRHGGERPHVLVTARTGPEAVVCVRDTGPGLPDNVRGWLAGREGSSGRLGLALTRRLVTIEGGRLWAEEQPDHHGTVMCASFPQRQSL